MVDFERSLITPEEDEIARTTLGLMISKLRKSRGLTSAQLGERIHMAQSSISKIESGTATIEERRLVQIIDALEATDEERGGLRAQFALISTSPLSYRHVQAHGIERKQREIQGYERRARTIEVFEPTIVPGLLQTPRYAAAVLRALGLAPELVSQAVEGRVARQSIIRESGRKLHFILNEAALYSSPGDVEVQLEQLRALRVQAVLDHPLIGIVPLQRGLPVGTSTSFVLINRFFVTTETVISEQQIKDPEDVQSFVALHGELAKRALHQEDSVHLIDKAIAHLTKAPDNAAGNAAADQLNDVSASSAEYS